MPKRQIFSQIISELENVTTPKQKTIVELIRQKHLLEVWIMEIDRNILSFRKDKSLDDIYKNFFESDALDERIVKLKKRGREKPVMVLLVNKEKQNLLGTLLCLEYIFEITKDSESKRYELQRLIHRKVICEMHLLDVCEQLMTESIEEADVLDLICGKILKGNFLSRKEDDAEMK